jgi:hypothetical protein
MPQEKSYSHANALHDASKSLTIKFLTKKQLVIVNFKVLAH